MKVECRTVLGIKSCYWRCVGDVKVAEFEGRGRNRGRTIILHPATRKPGTWQASRFTDGEPTGHTEGPSCPVLTKDERLSASQWKLKHVR